MSKADYFSANQDVGCDRPPQGPSEASSPPPYTWGPAERQSWAGSSSLTKASASLLPPPYNSSPQATRNTSAIDPNLPPRCNYLVKRKSDGNVNGTWHVDTAMSVLPSLLPPPTAFDGIWNSDVQNARKKQEKKQKKRDGWLSKMTSRERLVLPAMKEVRPNLMLHSTNGGVNGKVYVVSSDGFMRDSFIVAEGNNGSVRLSVYTSSGQTLRIHATSTNGSVKVEIPSSFQGALTASATNGSIKFSDEVKSKLTTFSFTSTSVRCFIGDWQAYHFHGTPAHAPIVSPPNTAGHPVSSSSPLNDDPFQTWTGPSIHIASTNGSVSLSFVRKQPVKTSSPPPESGSNEHMENYAIFMCAALLLLLLVLRDGAFLALLSFN